MKCITFLFCLLPVVLLPGRSPAQIDGASTTSPAFLEEIAAAVRQTIEIELAK